MYCVYSVYNVERPGLLLVSRPVPALMINSVWIYCVYSVYNVDRLACVLLLHFSSPIVTIMLTVIVLVLR